MTQMLDEHDLHRSENDRKEFDGLPRPHWLDAAARPKTLDPDPDYIAPSLFSHTLLVTQNIYRGLRSKENADRIMEQYWECVHPVACIVHRPSFQKRYDIFWSNVSRGAKDMPESTQALVYAALFAGVVSMDAEAVRNVLGGEREEWVKALENATAISLGRAHVIRTAKPETIQAFVMYLVRKHLVANLWRKPCSDSYPTQSKALLSETANRDNRSHCVGPSFHAPLQRSSHQLSILREAWDSIKTVHVSETTQ